MSAASADEQLHIVYLRSRMLLTKKQYANWRVIQREFKDFVASLGPWSTEEVICYLEDEYPEMKEIRVQVNAFMTEENTELELD